MYGYPPIWTAIWTIMTDDYQNDAKSLCNIDINYPFCHIYYLISISRSVSAFVASYP